MTNLITNINQIYNIIKSKQNILILPHILPDGDTIGSSIALYLSLQQKGKNPYILLDESIPQNLQFLPVKYIQDHLNSNFSPDLIITVDCSHIDRLGNRVCHTNASAIILNIDHHITNTYFGDYNLVFPKAAATGEIIYHLIKYMNVTITKNIATCLYTALSTDTGSFRYDNTLPDTHRVAADLLEYGIELNFITTELYQNKPLSKLKLLIKVLNSLELYFSGKLAILSLSNEMLEETEANPEDTDGIIEFARDIMGVEIGVLLKEMHNLEIKVGFRSKNNIDVSKIAEVFGGGGHQKASGCTIYDTLQNAKMQIIKTIKNYL